MVTVTAMNTKPTPPLVDEEVRTVEELALARVLEECLQAMEQGEMDLDGLAGRYPEAEEEIRPLLEIAQQLKGRRAAGMPLPLEFREELRDKLLAHHLSS